MASSTLIKEGSVRTPAVPHVTSLSVGKAKDAPASLPQSMLTQFLPTRCRGLVQTCGDRSGLCLPARRSAPRPAPGILTDLKAESGSSIAGGAGGRGGRGSYTKNVFSACSNMPCP